jgi:hypothetical protein
MDAAKLIGAVETWKFFLQPFQFGQIVEDNVGVAGIFLQVILMIVLGGIERFERNNFRNDGARIDSSGIQLGDVVIGDAFLFVVRIKNGGAILRTGVRALAIQLRGIVSHGKINH